MTTTIETACARAAVRPLLSAGRRVVVDGQPICDVCGIAVEMVAPGRWQHAAKRRRRTARSAWRGASQEQQREALRWLQSYRAGLAAAGRRRTLPPADNPYLRLAAALLESPRELSALLDLDERRRELASLFSWAIPSEAALDVLARHAPLVECGAGMGYWSALLRSRGVDVLAYDSAPPGAGNAYHRRARRPWTAVGRLSSVDAARRHRSRTLLLCWPPYDDDAASYAVLRAYRGDTLVYIGEHEEGATGSVRFHRELRLNWTLAERLELPHWPRLRDAVGVYRRNARRQPHVERDRCFECRRFIPTGALGRCEACFERRPPALALRVGRHRVEYPREVVDAMPPALRKAFERSPSRIR
jgi:hypothetical protein